MADPNARVVSLTVTASALSAIAGVFSEKYSWLSELSAASPGFEIASAAASVCP